VRDESCIPLEITSINSIGRFFYMSRMAAWFLYLTFAYGYFFLDI